MLEESGWNDFYLCRLIIGKDDMNII